VVLHCIAKHFHNIYIIFANKQVYIGSASIHHHCSIQHTVSHLASHRRVIHENLFLPFIARRNVYWIITFCLPFNWTYLPVFLRVLSPTCGSILCSFGSISYSMSLIFTLPPSLFLCLSLCINYSFTVANHITQNLRLLIFFGGAYINWLLRQSLFSVYISVA